MKCKYIIHAVGPVWQKGIEEPKQLLSCILESLSIADNISPPVSSISFPAISSGIFGFPKELCAKIFFDAITSYINERPSTNLRYIRLTNFDKQTATIFYDEIQTRKPKKETDGEEKTDK
mmetsp:Transcript_2909/g.2496  ORF Transcript_2909/g.2496 Transcript_2909/m.2496 type:complete len:120 (+) Transcript_2909:427-786(+)